MLDEQNRHDLIRAYDLNAAVRDNDRISSWKAAERKMFLDLQKKSGVRRILDLGSGPGRDSAFFVKEEFINTVAADFSYRMASCCRKRGIETVLMDIMDPCLKDSSFDAVWALNSLLHIPKRDLSQVLQNIGRLMTDDGLFYMGAYGGVDFEGILDDDVYEPHRFFSFYTDMNLKEIVARAFEIYYFNLIPLGNPKTYFHSLVLKKPN
nr:methyltransferase domain-containing protein [candidate division Zixibacteria bacterium]